MHVPTVHALTLPTPTDYNDDTQLVIQVPGLRWHRLKLGTSEVGSGSSNISGSCSGTVFMRVVLLQLSMTLVYFNMHDPIRMQRAYSW